MEDKLQTEAIALAEKNNLVSSSISPGNSLPIYLQNTPARERMSDPVRPQRPDPGEPGPRFTEKGIPYVYCNGIQYYDLQKVQYLSNTEIATLVELTKSILLKGMEVQFINVHEKIIKRIKSMGLDHILNCSR